MTEGDLDRPDPGTGRHRPRSRWAGYPVAVVVCIAIALLAAPLAERLDQTNIVMLFLLGVVAVALRFGRGPAVVAAFVGVGLFDFGFVQPRLSFGVGDAQYLLTFAVMLIVALVIGQLTAGLKAQVGIARERERRVRSLYDLARDLSGVLLPEEVAQIAARFARSDFAAHGIVLVPDDGGRLRRLPARTAGPGDAGSDGAGSEDAGSALTEQELAVARRAHECGELAGRGAAVLPDGPCLALPLKAPMKTRGAWVLRGTDAASLGPETRRLLETAASLLAISLERLHYVEAARQATVQIESERLRNALLSAISHDLRTPLAALVGLADTLRLTRPAPTPQQDEIVAAIRESAARMRSLVVDLLDMARFEAGAVRLDRQWLPLEEVVGSARAACREALAGRDVRIRLPAELPLVEIDAVLIERVFLNLLENAARHTPPGSPIDVEAGLDGDRIAIRVADRGPGLPPGREAAIFDKFERGQPGRSSSGIGLGLAICRAIVAAHGGSIRAARRDGGGSVFEILLPAGLPPALEELPPAADPADDAILQSAADPADDALLQAAADPAGTGTPRQRDAGPVGRC